MHRPDSKHQPSQKSKSGRVANYALPFIGFGLLLGGVAWLSQPHQFLAQQRASAPSVQSQIPAVNPSVALEPARNWQANNHVHGLAINPVNSEIIYVASHNGLLYRSLDGGWYWMGKERSDYMGFTADPNHPHRFYSSGHPPTGGNLGFQITENQGQDWQQISMPSVDFHALAIAPNNPQIFYGFPASGAEGFHVSMDGGKTWKQTRMDGLGDHPFNLAVDPQNSNRVFATTRSGLYESRDRGEHWTLLTSTQNVPIAGLALQKEGDLTIIYSYWVAESSSGLYRSIDSGKTWEKWRTGLDGIVLHLAIAPHNSQIFYAVNEKNVIFQSRNGGKVWKTLS